MRTLPILNLMALLVWVVSASVACAQTALVCGPNGQTNSRISVHDPGHGEQSKPATPERHMVSNPHVVKYERLPTQWAEGFPLGNGELGVMCWSDGRRIRFTVDSAGAWDLRRKSGELDYLQLSYRKLREWVAAGDFGAIDAAAKRMGERDPLRPTKVYLGRFDLDCEFASDSQISLCLADASVRGILANENTTHTFHAFVCRTRDLFCLRLDPWPDGAQLKLVPFYESSPQLVALGHPKMGFAREGELTVAIQQVLPDTHFALCWNSDGPHIFVSFAKANDPETAKAEALAKHPHHGRDSFSGMFELHQRAWQQFWSTSGVSLPEKDLEFLWYYGIYVLASCARDGSNPPGLQGLWPMDGRVPPWRGDYHTDMNVQETFWPALPSGHLELMDVWLDFAYETLPIAEKLTRQIFGTEGAFQHCSLLPEYTPLFGGGWHPVAFAWSHTGWLAHLAWLRWQYSKDTEWLARRGYPIVRSAFLFYSANLEEEDDGRYHIPLSSSPEYCGPAPSAWCKDPNIDIALIRKCCDWVREMEQALHIDELSDRASQVHEKLVPYHLVEFDYPGSYVKSGAPKGQCVLALWKDKLLDYSHRHPSHLMAIHPAMDITIDGPEDERKIIDASIRHYLALGQYCWAGHTYVQMVCLAAVTGEPEMAYNFLRCYRDRWILPNGLHFNKEIGRQGNSHFSMNEIDRFSAQAPFTINETCGISCGISDMLVQGWGDCIRVFPAVPSRWKDLLFVDLLTEGAFEVSALMRSGRVTWVRITARVDGPCRLHNPFVETEFRASGCTPKRQGDVLHWPMSAGQTVILSVPGIDEPDIQQEADAIRAQGGEWLSLE